MHKVGEADQICYDLFLDVAKIGTKETSFFERKICNSFMTFSIDQISFYCYPSKVNDEYLGLFQL